MLRDSRSVWRRFAAGRVSEVVEPSTNDSTYGDLLSAGEARKADFRATIPLLRMLVVGWRAILMANAGHIDRQIFTERLVLFPVVLLGGHFGMRALGRISELRFTCILQVIVFVGTLVLIWRGGVHFLRAAS